MHDFPVPRHEGADITDDVLKVNILATHFTNVFGDTELDYDDSSSLT